ncbi:MAG: aspartate-semialdehyde dehydrogenase [Bacteroidetes bacterium]|nr:MAG: aspartate-semialdehyde dehydrogenase [Bacteroidota bacterium]
MKIAIVGATGLVGREILNVLKEFNFSFSELLLCGSSKSAGKKILFDNQEFEVLSIEDVLSRSPDIAIFSAGSEVSKQYAPEFASKGCFVIDNSSAWRMDATKKLIVPEINGELLTENDKIIANPNCSTIQMVMVLAPLHKAYIIKRIVISTYQSVSGTGKKGLEQLENERKGIQSKMVYPYPIDKNCLPHAGDFDENGYTTEEIKLVNETKKILSDNNISITATAVRVPVEGGHSESVNVEFEKPYELTKIYQLLSQTPGVKVVDNPELNMYPMPLFAKGKNDVFVGRIRKDFSVENGLNLWIVADNLRKGAATNAVQIAELVKNKLLSYHQ